MKLDGMATFVSCRLADGNQRFNASGIATSRLRDTTITLPF